MSREMVKLTVVAPAEFEEAIKELIAEMWEGEATIEETEKYTES